MARTRTTSPHAEWLSLLDISGPFLSLPVLNHAFPQGIDTDTHESEIARWVRRAYTDEWLPNRALSRPSVALQTEWIDFVLGEVLEWPSGLVAAGQSLPPGLEAPFPEFGETLRPTRALLNPTDRDGGKARVLVAHYPPEQGLDAPLRDERIRWKASPVTRMTELLRATGVRLGLVTNGEQWLLVNAPVGEPTGLISWYAHLWLEERVTLQAFRALLGGYRLFGVPDDETLEGLLTRSAQDQAEVTTQLGDQVRQALELLVDAIDRADRDRSGALLAGVTEADVYEAAVTVMMRLVFLLFAEDQRPPLFGNEPLYDAHYAVSSLIDQLQAQADSAGEEVLERKEDAWSRLLSTFRLVHGGSDHDQMRLPAYGGSLFDPDRFAFLEGRARGTDWERDDAKPLPINNRTVLHILEAIQFIEMRGGRLGSERRRLSFRALDVEQIGHVYERLLEHTVRRAVGPVLGLTGSTKGGVRQEPEIRLADLESWRERGDGFLLAELVKPTGRTTSQLNTSLTQPLELGADTRFLVACDNDADLWARVRPFAGLIRADRAGRPWIVRDRGLYVTSGTDRRQSGAHYTPRSLTESIVQHALESLVYDGPAEGAPKEAWRLRPASALLALKICDPAMGSGAFLVQACRYLSERLVEAWSAAESVERSASQGQIRISPDGRISHGQSEERLLPVDPAERLALARQLVTDHCLYGVDINPLAVEMAKLSLWLVTLQKDRPFTFLDHRLRQGDSLIGIGDIKQLEHWSLSGEAPRKEVWFKYAFDDAFKAAIKARREIEETPVLTAEHADEKARKLAQAEDAVATVRIGADLLIAAALVDHPQRRERLRLDYQNQFALALNVAKDRQAGTFRAAHCEATLTARDELSQRVTALLNGHRPFHWLLEFPEVMIEPTDSGESPGFAAVVGNPPFMGGKKITGVLGTPYRDYLLDVVAGGVRGSADLCAYFVLRAGKLCRSSGSVALLATNTIAQGDTREVALDRMFEGGFTIPRAVSSRPWPGVASLEISHLWLWRGKWSGKHVLNEVEVDGITPFLTVPSRVVGIPWKLDLNQKIAFVGSVLSGAGFILDADEAQDLLLRDDRNRDVIFRYLTGEDLNTRPDQSPSRWVINFHDWPLERAMEYPEPFRIVQDRVQPQRAKTKRQIYRENWWKFAERVPGLYQTIARCDRVLVRAQVSKTHALVFFEPGIVFSVMVIPIALDTWSDFGLLQSNLHEAWVNAYSSSLKGDQRYTPTDSFETFPRAGGTSTLDVVAQRMYEDRQGIIAERTVGLTQLYNLFHNEHNSAGDLQRLRIAHQELDNTVAAAYGWDDLDLSHGFHETKQGVRFTISDAARREVLDRLLELNQQRYADEVAMGLHDKSTRKRAPNGRLQDHQQSLIAQWGEDVR
ncbi:MAG: BREX-1 system adenine-specific DNA-methyltransferase PglX [Chloroflexota bacterium]|nr:BREX-1 system adenine-specific DNA-methyltransferase PglX [Chloroflexota bacterium]